MDLSKYVTDVRAAGVGVLCIVGLAMLATTVTDFDTGQVALRAGLALVLSIVPAALDWFINEQKQGKRQVSWALLIPIVLLLFMSLVIGWVIIEIVKVDASVGRVFYYSLVSSSIGYTVALLRRVGLKEK